MIGGYDLICEIDIDAELALHLACEAALRFWPDCVVEDSEESRPVTRHGYGFELSGVHEVMIFKNQEFRKKWRELGSTSETEDTMVQVFAEDRALTLVVSNPNRNEVKDIVTVVQNKLKDSLFHETCSTEALQ
jgi:hypothetical protein